MSIDESKRIRASNYSSTEKKLLFNIIRPYKSVIECKKKRAPRRDKIHAWAEITKLFNAQSTNSELRTTESLKKFYKNKKREARITLANNRAHQIARDAQTQLKFNRKTITNLANNFDWDLVVDGNDSDSIRKALPLDLDSINNVDIINNDSDKVFQTIHSYCDLAVSTAELVDLQTQELKKSIARDEVEHQLRKKKLELEIQLLEFELKQKNVDN